VSSVKFKIKQLGRQPFTSSRASVEFKRAAAFAENARRSSVTWLAQQTHGLLFKQLGRQPFKSSRASSSVKFKQQRLSQTSNG